MDKALEVLRTIKDIDERFDAMMFGVFVIGNLNGKMPVDELRVLFNELKAEYATEVKREMFTKEELKLTLATMQLMKLESGMRDKTMDSVIKKLTELSDLISQEKV